MASLLLPDTEAKEARCCASGAVIGRGRERTARRSMTSRFPRAEDPLTFLRSSVNLAPGFPPVLRRGFG